MDALQLQLPDQRLQIHNILTVDVAGTLADIPKLSTDDLHRVMNTIKGELAVRGENLAELVEYIPDFCQDNTLLEQVQMECDSLELSSSRRKAATQWLSPKEDPYIYPDTNPIHRAKDISNFPAIKKLLSHINTSSEVVGPLDACLVIKYNSEETALSLHADDEDIQDQSKAICSFTLGASRTVEFFSKARKPKPVTSVRTGNNGLLIMRPGTQDKMKHCVRSDQEVMGRKPREDNISTTHIRYALSFRALAGSSPPLSIVQPTTVTNQKPQPLPPKRKMCLIAGDSFAERLVAERLEKKRLTVKNIGKGGAKIKAVSKQIEDFFSSNPDVCVEKLIVSVGTNDLRNAHNGINHLKGPLKQLCNTIDKLSPNTKVFFQSLLPLPTKDY